jgi:uroporphyrinogen decarboxylase
MTPRERLTTVLKGDIPDCVPVSPDFSNMIPARLTGKPFWDLYLYNDPPIWQAYIDAAKRFDIDSLMDGYFWLSFPDEQDCLPWQRLPATPEQQKQIVPNSEWQRFIVFKNSERIVIQRSRIENRKRVWEPRVCVYYVADSPTEWIPPSKIGLPDIPTRFEPLENVKPVDNGPAGLARVKQLMGNQGLVGVFLASSAILSCEQDIYDYYDHPELHDYWRDTFIERVERRFASIMKMSAVGRADVETSPDSQPASRGGPVLPDFLCVGGSGTLVFQTVDIFRQLAYPAVKRAIELAAKAGIPTHIHSCGPETALIKIMAEETSLTVIDPLEIPPMGDCNLAEIKKLYGRKLTLKGNLHTTETMLYGSPDDVIAASKKAIDDAAEGGRFILSTGDQCGRDTPDQNLLAMVETARTYGKY